MKPTVIAAASILWEWLPIEDPPARFDMIFILGNKSDALPGKAAELFTQGLASFILVAGGNGRLTKYDATSEAERYRKALRTLHIPERHILVERESANTGENIAFAKRLIRQEGIICRTAMAVTTAMLSRRHRASLAQQWPEVSWRVVTPGAKPFNVRMAEDNVADFFNLMAGEVDRLEYYPARGFIKPINIPKEIRQAKAVLFDAGYNLYQVS